MQSALKFSGKVQQNGVFKVEFSRQDGPFKEQNFNRNPEYFADGYLAFFMPGTFSGTTGTSTGANGSSTSINSNGSSSANGTSATGTAGALDQVFVAGEIPLRENEVSKFEQALEQANIWIPAIHNHEIQENPRLIFVHVETVGSAHQIAAAIRRAMDATRGNFKEEQQKQLTSTSISGLSNIAGTIGYSAQLQEENGVLILTVPRQENFSDCAVAITQAANTNGTSGSTTGTGATTSGTTGTGSASTGSSGTSTSAGTGTTGTAGSSSGASSVGMSADAGVTANNCLLESLQAQPGMSNGSTGSTAGTSGTTGGGSPGTTGATTGTSGTLSSSSSSMNLIPPQVGAESMFRFEMGGNGSVDVDAEFALLATEAPQTVRLLRENGFVVSALHNHFAFESPRLLFLHASGQGSASKLAQVIRMALDQNAALSGTSSTGTGSAGTGSTGTSSTGSTGSTGTSSTGTSSTGNSGTSSTSSGPAL